MTDVKTLPEALQEFAQGKDVLDTRTLPVPWELKSVAVNSYDVIFLKEEPAAVSAGGLRVSEFLRDCFRILRRGGVLVVAPSFVYEKICLEAFFKIGEGVGEWMVLERSKAALLGRPGRYHLCCPQYAGPWHRLYRA